ncbi:MFS transporter [Streptomyces sp. NPDC012888]|uniref:MFS transporter n=1 Tax=Streptomyces sp. NPDC012888 TaxID=3364855 RepID=UPI0036B840A9
MPNHSEKGAAQAPFAATVIMMSVAALLVVGQTFITIPLMPELGRAWEVPTKSAAWATTAFAIAYACGSLVSGPLSNRYGRRTVMSGSMAAMAVATALVPLADGLGTASALRALQGAMAGSFVPMSYAYLGERLPKERLPLALTTVNCAAGATVVVGQVEGQLIGTALGWRWVFLISAPLLALAALAAWKIMLPDPVRTADTPKPAVSNGVLASAALLPLFAITLALVGSLTAVYTAVQLNGPAELVGDPEAMLWLRASALPAMVIAVLIASVLGRIPALRRASFSLAFAGVALAAAALTGDSTVLLGVTLFLFVLGISTVGPAVVQAIGDSAGPSRATAIAVYGFVLNLGSGVGAQLPLAISDFTAMVLTVAAALGIGILLVAMAARAAAGRTAATPAPVPAPAAAPSPAYSDER